MSTMLPFIGIDFGTSKCAMAWYNPQIGQAQVIRNFEGKDETPSVVYLGKSENEIVVGELAMRKLGQNPKDQQYLVVSVKRNLLTAPTKVLDGNRMYRPVDIAARILGKLRVDAETQHFHEPVTRAVITYPASFGPLQQDKIKQAATIAGFSEVALLPEPVAAALAYGYTGLKVGNYILVYDFGGGTFDVAVLARAERSFTWAAEPKGLETCGGDDLDRELYDYCEEIARQQLHRGISLDDDINLSFLLQCRERKENLSAFSEEDFSSYLPSDNGPVLFQHTLKREMFEQRIKKYIDQTVSLTQEVMRGAEAGGSKVDTVVLIGGSSRIPMVPRLLSSTLSVNPQEFAQKDFAVALGAAYYGIQIWPLDPHHPPPPPPPPTPSEVYRQAIRGAWEPTRMLTQAKVNELGSLAKRLGLSADAAKTIEQEIIGHSKEEILIQQHFADLAEYSTAVARAWLDKFLTPAKINDLAAQVNRLGLSRDEVAIIEWEIMADTKEGIDERQRHQWALSEYRSSMKRVWEPNMILSQPQLAELAAQANKFGLSRDEVATIERQVIGDTKEVIWERQCRRNDVNEYRAVVRRAWEPNRTLTPAQLAELATQVTRLGLSQGEAIAIEREIMGDTKERIDERQRHQWALSEYRAVVRRVWEPNRMLTKAQVSELATQVNRLGLNKDKAAAIERQVIGDTKEVIWERQRHLNALTEYRAIVRRVWEPNRMLTKAQVAELTVHMVRLGLSREEGAIIEREIVGKEIIERGLLSNVRSWGKKL